MNKLDDETIREALKKAPKDKDGNIINIQISPKKEGLIELIIRKLRRNNKEDNKSGV